VWDLTVAGQNQAQIDAWMQDTKEWKTRFAGMEKRRQAGLPDISVTEYLNLEAGYMGVFRAYGMPTGLYDDPADFADYIGRDLSVDEINTRVAQTAVWVRDADPFEKQQIQALYGWTEGDMIAAALDPDRALPFLDQRRAAAEIAAQSMRTGYGQLSTQEAEGLYAMGVNEASAAQGFAQLETFEPLFQEGINETGGDFTRQQQLDVAFGNNVEQQQRLSRRARARVTSGMAGGGAVTTQTGSGLGTAT
jgi:hypothetical protein